MHCMRVEFGKEIYWSQTLRSWKIWTSEIHVRRLNAKEIITPKRVTFFIFPSAEGTVKLSGRDQVFRKATLKYGIIPHEAKSIKMIFKENRTGLSRTSFIINKWDSHWQGSGKFAQDANTRVWSTENSTGNVRKRNQWRSIEAELSEAEDRGKETHRSKDQDTKLSRQKWMNWSRSIGKDSKQGRMSALTGNQENAINGKRKDSAQREILPDSATMVVRVDK